MVLPIVFVVCGICESNFVLFRQAFIASLPVCGIKLVVHQYTVSSGDDTVTKWAVATIAATLATNVLCTTLIITRIIGVARRQCSMLGMGLRTYRGVLEILVESAALYSISYLLLMIFYPLSGNGYMFAQMLVYPITVRLLPSVLHYRFNDLLGYSTYSNHSSGCFRTGSARRILA